ncbi:hypothetical protein CDD80_6811 [Ophiocordyceps camponoti-rufipedis]|uniref:Methyltransferase domain-containing protein n=1 Tax=Ophiocordyceps camponoti-rufipedis TaxID=2004952 RepID=A0A2C5YK60_9HYPO|nr:hypothetical protein CDD80_6811 [Ophiocordyceps camponoti-rufipedis]
MGSSQESASPMSGEGKWFDRAPPKLTAEMRAVFENYSGISPSDAVSHIHQIRDRAFKVTPYPCVGRYLFLELSLSRTPFYEDIKQRLIHGEKFLDLGCGFGQELRKLALDGVPTRNLYGCDLNAEFIRLGYEVFLDKGKNQMTFFETDILDPESELRCLDGQISFINAQLFFHLFPRSQQIQLAKRLVALLDPTKDSLIVGRHLAHSKVTECNLPGAGYLYVHSQDSWKCLWDEVGRLTRTLWDVEIVQEAREVEACIKEATAGPEAYWMWFTIRKLSPLDGPCMNTTVSGFSGLDDLTVVAPYTFRQWGETRGFMNRKSLIASLYFSDFSSLNKMYRIYSPTNEKRKRFHRRQKHHPGLTISTCNHAPMKKMLVSQQTSTIQPPRTAQPEPVSPVSSADQDS